MMDKDPNEPRLQSPGVDATPTDVRTLYRHALERRGFIADAAQERAVERLQRLYDEWRVYKARRPTRLHRSQWMVMASVG